MTITLTREEAQPEPELVRLRRGDILRCIETNELCTVWATSTTGKTQVKWKANDFGEYTAEQIGDLFWVELKPKHWSDCAVHSEPAYPAGECDCGLVPVAWEYCGALFNDKEEVFAWHERGDISNTPPKPLYSAPPQREWQGLTDEERVQVLHSGDKEGYLEYAKGIEAKLKEKNT